MPFPMNWLLVVIFVRPIAGKQPAIDFDADLNAQPPAPATMNADFFEDPPAGVPLAPAPSDSQDLVVQMQALPPAPATEMNEAMPPAPLSEDYDDQDQDSRQPTWGDYAAQQSVNAKLAEKVAELTKATHLLWREERTLRRRSHQQILKLKKKCHIQHNKVHVELNPLEEQPVQQGNLRQKPTLPVSLTHAATRHHQQKVNDLTKDGADKGPLVGTSVGSMAGLYNTVDAPIAPAHDERSQESTKKKRELEDELAASRARLGRNEEARLHLERQIKELEETYQKGMKEAARRQEDLVAAQKRQRAKELELEKVKKELADGIPTIAASAEVPAPLSGELPSKLRESQERIEKEKQDLLTYRDQADIKLRARKNEARNLQAKNTELRQQLQTQVDAEQKTQDELKAAQDTWSQLTGQVEALHRDEAEVSQEQQSEQSRLMYENDKLQSEAEQERHCMDWGHRLDARLQHELRRKVADAKLCRDSILSLHNERLELKDKSAKYKREIEEARLHENEVRRSYEENQQLLDHCLGQMTAR
eukprot:gnl/MRDRNA2_/MRDRNA2_114428_c0_seq1.p1 gnl/MRDRNA2_/MRDRNA2_114428_c0~~gnl/MRDRNA2_/MRDRNA2_114428_c0_seq1.p1  ORF type:complete len:535 (-),score=154.77 gnl/MRDRNA2_/MRDRNA2_114428_c0_seq1:26-1630(-)